jgi:hypothetical protein
MELYVITMVILQVFATIVFCVTYFADVVDGFVLAAISLALAIWGLSVLGVI